jgi:hypothetical protein
LSYIDADTLAKVSRRHVANITATAKFAPTL